jgi:hypothetical protein
MKTKQRFDIDPILEKIAPHIPDEEINFLFPFRKFNSQGRTRRFQTSQLYRAHILALLKGVSSFNKLCAEFKSRRSFRDFCHLKNKKATPVKRMLSEFGDHLKPSGFEKIAQLILLDFLNIAPLSEITVAIPDATDMPANCNGFAKKNAIVRESADVLRSTPRKEPQKGNELRKAAKVLTLLDIKNILCASG